MISKDGYIVVGKPNCPFCLKACETLEVAKVDYIYLPHRSPPGENMKGMTDQKTYPYIFKFVGGSDDLEDQLLNDGYLM
jgi:glutaredoxin